jgi:hypothetical protein
VPSPARSRPDRRRLLGIATLVGCALQWLGASAAAAAGLDIVAVIASAADRQVSLVADIRPATGTPVPAGSFSVTTGGVRLPARAAPVFSDRLAVALVVDASSEGAQALQAGLSGAASFLLQLPTGAQMAAVVDTSPPAVVAPPHAGAAEVLGALDRVRPGGERNTSDALTLALKQLGASPDSPRVLALYTSAPDAGGEAPADLAARLTKAHALLAVVATGADEGYWSRVTADTGGVLVTARAGGAMAAFDDVAETLRGRYLLTFPLPRQLPANVSVRVRTADGTLTAESLITAEPTAAAPDAGGATRLRILALAAGAFTVTVWVVALILRSRAAPSARPEPPVAAVGSAIDHEPRPPPGESGDERAYLQLDAQIGTVVAAVAKGQLDPRRAVARIALAASGRPDLLDRAADTERRMAGSRFADWPPTPTALDLLAAARRVTTGDSVLTGPEGVRVEQAALTDQDGTTRTLLRVTRNGRSVRDCTTVEELARHVDLSSLAGEPGEDPGEDPGGGADRP